MYLSRPPSLRTIAAFEAAARHENFARAAGELHLTESAISHSVRSLEDQLGRPLFDRHGRSVRVTAQGRWLAARLRLILMLLSQTLETVDAEQEADALRVSADPSFSASVLLPAWSRFAQARPGLSLALRPDRAPADVEAGGPDLVIRFGSAPARDHCGRQLTREPLVPVGLPSMACPFDEPWRLPLVETESHPWAIWSAHAGHPGGAGHIALTVSDFGMALDAARAGVGACLAPLNLVGPELRSGRLVALGRPTPAMQDGYVAEWSGASPRLALIEAFVDWLHASLATPVAEEPPAAPYPRLAASA